MKAVKTQAAQVNETAQSSLLSQEDLKVLKAAFPKDRLGVKVQSLNKDRTRAMLVLYLQHTDVQDRLEQVDPAWTSEVLSETTVGDTVYVRSRMTVKGVSRENVGEGGDPKAAYSDALKRCAMLFGVGRYLYDSSTVWVEYNEQKDRYRQWSVDDYESGLNPVERYKKPPSPEGKQNDGKPKSKSPSASPAPTPITPASEKEKTSAGTAVRPREELNRVLMNLYRPYLTQFPQTQFAQILTSRYNVTETRLMTVEQLEDLVQYMEEKLRSVA